MVGPAREARPNEPNIAHHTCHGGNTACSIKRNLASFVGSCETKTVALGRPFFFVAMGRGLQRFNRGVYCIVVWLDAWVLRDINEANDAFGIKYKCYTIRA